MLIKNFQIELSIVYSKANFFPRFCLPRRNETVDDGTIKTNLNFLKCTISATEFQKVGCYSPMVGEKQFFFHMFTSELGFPRSVTPNEFLLGDKTGKRT